MKMAKLYEATGALVAGMDKKKAARQAALVASAVANGNGAPHTRIVARVVAHTLTAIGNPQADGAAAVTTALGSEAGPAAEPDISDSLQASFAPAPVPQTPTDRGTTIQWQQVAEAMRRVQTLGASADFDRAGSTPQTSPRASGQARSAASPRRVERGTMTGSYDAVNVGSFTFSVMRSQQNVQLSVGQIGVPGNAGGLFSLIGVPASVWVRLQDRGNRLLPVWVGVDGQTVEIMVGDGPQSAPILRAIDVRVGSS
jgi:hypothetical protein